MEKKPPREDSAEEKTRIVPGGSEAKIASLPYAKVKGFPRITIASREKSSWKPARNGSKIMRKNRIPATKSEISVKRTDI